MRHKHTVTGERKSNKEFIHRNKANLKHNMVIDDNISYHENLERQKNINEACLKKMTTKIDDHA